MRVTAAKPIARGKRRDDLEVHDRFDANTSKPARISHAGNSHDDRQEDDGSNQHSDQFDKTIAKRLHLLSHMGIEEADGDSSKDAHDDATQS
jgi:hypothetical protein